MREPEAGLDEWDDDDWDEDAYFDEPYDYCPRCDGEGELMACPDDLCRGAGECAFGARGKGCFVECPSCRGSGEIANL